jgi:predicted glycoside hydrolase/deacetylase ChbG (UPF0249 family)
LTELYLHPGSSYAREEELDALLSPRVRDAIEEHGIQLVRYGTAS